MNVEKLIQELLKIENQQMEVYFKTGKGLPVMEGISIKAESVNKEIVVTLEGPQTAVVITGE